MAMRRLLPAGQASAMSRKYAGIGQAIGVTSFLTMPSASAIALADLERLEKIVEGDDHVEPSQAGASGISSAVMRPVVPKARLTLCAASPRKLEDARLALDRDDARGRARCRDRASRHR